MTKGLIFKSQVRNEKGTQVSNTNLSRNILRQINAKRPIQPITNTKKIQMTTKVQN